MVKYALLIDNGLFEKANQMVQMTDVGKRVLPLKKCEETYSGMCTFELDMERMVDDFLGVNMEEQVVFEDDS